LTKPRWRCIMKIWRHNEPNGIHLKSAAKLSNKTGPRQSGTEYTFKVYSLDTKFNKDYEAVYFVTKRVKKTNGGYSHIRIYVGETGDLSTRFDNHHKQDCFDENGANCICIYGEQDEKTRLKIEKDLIEKYNPPCNSE